MSEPIYLDNAATTPLDERVAAAMLPFIAGGEFANPSSLYRAARSTRAAVETARHSVANVLGAKVTEIVFTSGGTEGDNLAIQGVLRAHPGAHWITNAIEHDAVIGCVEPMRRFGHKVSVVGVRPSGIVDPADIAAQINDETVLISLMLANNEIGTIQPVSSVAKIIADVRADRASRGLTHPIYLHTDACQAAGALDLHVTRLGVDLLVLNGSKIYGPKGVGALYVRQGTALEPLVYGGGQERGRRSGTENIAGAVGLAAALDIAATERESTSHLQTGLRDDLIRRLSHAIPGIILNGDSKRRLPNNVNFTIPGAEGEGMVLYLDQQGIMGSTGSACSSGDLDPSHVLLALGRTVAEANSSLRLTLGRFTTESDITEVVKKLPPIARRLREVASEQN